MPGSILTAPLAKNVTLVAVLLACSAGAPVTSAHQAANAGQNSGAQAFLGLVAAERAFFKATTELGMRDGFLTFFATDASEVDAGDHAREPRLLSARERLQKMPLPPRPLPRRIDWDPRHGDVSGAGDLGYLTGPFAVIDLASGRTIQQGLYTSVWRKQQDDTWKVIVDHGVMTPEAVELGRAGDVTRDGAAAPQSAATSLESAEADLARAAGSNPAAAYHRALYATARIGREGSPLVTGTAAATLIDKTFASLAILPLRIECAASGDFGFSLSAYSAMLKSGAREYGATLRIWKHMGSGWRIVHEVIKPSPAGTNH